MLASCRSVQRFFLSDLIIRNAHNSVAVNTAQTVLLIADSLGMLGAMLRVLIQAHLLSL